MKNTWKEALASVSQVGRVMLLKRMFVSSTLPRMKAAEAHVETVNYGKIFIRCIMFFWAEMKCVVGF